MKKNLFFAVFVTFSLALFSQKRAPIGTGIGTGSAHYIVDPFVTTWRVTSADKTIKIITWAGETYNYRVNWGDGTVESGKTSTATHTYATPGDYTVSITGVFPRIYSPNSDPNAKHLIAINKWGDNKWKSMNYAFNGSSNLEYVDNNNAPNLSLATDMSSMFALCTKLDQPLNHWNVSTITNMSRVFLGATNFNQPLNNWKTHNVRNMSYMFATASKFNKDLSGWDLSKVRNMGYMFRNATSFNKNISGWNVSSATDLSYMFSGANQFNQNLGSWNIRNVGRMYGMLDNTKLSRTNYEATLIGWSNLPLIRNNVPFGAKNLTYCSNAAKLARKKLTLTKGWRITGDILGCEPKPFITTWKVTAADKSITIPTYAGETYNYTVDWGDGTTTTNATGNATHTYPSAGEYTVKITGLFPRIYFGYNIPGVGISRNKILAVNQWGDNQWTSMERAFQNCTNLEVLDTANAPDLSLADNLSFMFGYCSNFNQSLNHWDVSTIKYMSAMFISATNFNQNLADWDVSNVVRLSRMFSNTNFNYSLASWDISNVTGTMSLSGQLSRENYEATLIGWSELPLLQNNVSLSNYNLKYCSSEAIAARNKLINDYNWNVQGDILLTGCRMSKNTSFHKNTKENTSTSLASFSKELFVYPNPAKETLQWRFPQGAVANSRVQVLDLSGKVVLKSTGNTQLNIAGLTKGIYILQVQNGTEMVQTKFIKE